jgi:adenylate cyclase
MGIVLFVSASCAVALFALGYVLFASAHFAIPILAPSAELIFGLVMTAAFISSSERKLRVSLERAVRQWLPGEVVDKVLLQPSEAPALPAAETSFAICLATDVEGFTAIAEKLSLPALDDLMKEYFEALFATVRHYGGAISNIAGDGTLSAWKAGRESPDARAAALTAALDLSAAIKRFNARHPATPFLTRIGIHAGEVVFSAVGDSGYHVATVVGDTANAVSRIESLNSRLRTRILASEEALSGTHGFASRPLGAFLVEGRSQPLRVVELLGRSEGEPPMPPERVQSFAAALAAFDEGNWSEAILAFEKLRRDDPHDGPVSFFLHLAEAYSRDPPRAVRPLRVNVK